jgi:hypothetical protein
MRKLTYLFPAAAAFTLVACAAKPPAHDTTVRGTVSALSYPSAPTSVVARDETGRALATTLGASGAFSLTLPHGHHYALAVVTSAGEVPMAFPRKTGRLDLSFAVRSRGGSVDVGAVHYFAQAPATSSSTDDQNVECGDGSNGSENADDLGTSAQADRAIEVSVPDRDAPESVDGCDNGDTEQEGEH